MWSSAPIEGYYLGIRVQIVKVLSDETIEGGRWVDVRWLDPDAKKNQFGMRLKMWSAQIMAEPWGDRPALTF